MHLRQKRLFLQIFLFSFLLMLAPCRAEAAGGRNPNLKEIEVTNQHIKLTWKKVSGVSGYEVCRKEKGTKYRTIAKVKDNTFTDKKVKAGIPYQYRIIARSGQGKGKAQKVTLEKLKAPELKSLSYYSSKNHKCALLKWRSTQDCSFYYVYRKTGNGAFRELARVDSRTSPDYSYTDQSCREGTKYTYTVRGVKRSGKILSNWTNYDKDGIKTVTDRVTPKADMQNLRAVVSWNAAKGKVTGYKILRKIGLDGTYRVIGTANGKRSYSDVYYDSLAGVERDCLNATNFIDPCRNSLVYTVRPYVKKDGKISYGDYYTDGDFSLTEPTIINAESSNGTDAYLEWGTVEHAKKYILYAGNAKGWKKAATVKAKARVRQHATIPISGNQTGFAVQAVAEKNGKTVRSTLDKSFDISNRRYSNKNILYLGDSITFGSPYKAEKTVEVFSYPWRVSQLLGVNFYNPSIAGATYSSRPYRSSRYRLVTDVAARMRDGRTPLMAIHDNTQTYKDFDVVVLAAGTNDYLDDTKLGDLNSTDTTTFNGAVNAIMEYIQEGSIERMEEGKAPIKIVFVDLFYSDRTYKYAKRTNRFKTKNHLGLTLTDYQDALDLQFKKYQAEGLELYHFETDRLVTEATCPYLTTDNLHMTKPTYAKIGNAFAQFLLSKDILTDTYSLTAEPKEDVKSKTKPESITDQEAPEGNGALDETAEGIEPGAKPETESEAESETEPEAVPEAAPETDPPAGQEAQNTDPSQTEPENSAGDNSGEIGEGSGEVL